MYSILFNFESHWFLDVTSAQKIDIQGVSILIRFCELYFTLKPHTSWYIIGHYYLIY